MRIGIDVRYLSHGLVGGVHTYVAQIIPALIKLSTDHEIVLYADTKRAFELEQLPPHVALRLLPWHSALSSIQHDLFLRRQMEHDRLDVAHFTGNYGFGPRGVPTVVTLQDEINVLPLPAIVRSHRKDLRTIAMMTYLHVMTKASLRQANRVITVSEYSKRQICHHNAISTEKVMVVPHGCPGDIQRIVDERVQAEVRERLRLDRPFILAEAFKNPAVVVRAWRALPVALRNTHEIIFFSRSPDVLPVVHKAIEAGFGRMFVRPARADLSALYTMATAFVFPSWIEGFGIPLVEAMTCGAPIIASDRGAIPEVVGDAARLIDAEDAVALTQHLIDLMTTPSAAADLQDRGFRRARQFTWRNAATTVIELYTKCSHTSDHKPYTATRLQEGQRRW